MPTYYRAPVPHWPTNPGDWFSPRRRHHVEVLVYYLAWGGCRAWLDRKFYADLLDDHRLYRHQVDQAIDDAFELGMITIRPSGGTWVIELLNNDVDDLPHAPQPHHRVNGNGHVGHRRQRPRATLRERGRA